MRFEITSALLLGSLLTLFSSSLMAAKMYKWVDENGETHFSQTPPVKGVDKVEPEAVSVQRVKVSGIVPHESEGYQYCGEFQLPRERKKYPFTIPQLNKKVESWRKSKARASDNLKRYLAPKKTSRYRSSRYRNDTTFSDKLTQLQKPVRQYQCAIDWANAKVNGIRSERSERQAAVEKAQRNLSIARTQQQQYCGQEPPEYNQYGKGRDRYIKWERCIRKYSAVVRKMESKLDAAERNLGKRR